MCVSCVPKGELTDLRIALVSNINLAVVAVRLGIHKFLEYTDPNLWTFINNFSDAVSKGVSNIWKLEVGQNFFCGGLLDLPIPTGSDCMPLLLSTYYSTTSMSGRRCSPTRYWETCLRP